MFANIKINAFVIIIINVAIFSLVRSEILRFNLISHYAAALNKTNRDM